MGVSNDKVVKQQVPLWVSEGERNGAKVSLPKFSARL